MDTLLTWVVCAVGLCGAELAYWLPLKKRRNFTMRTALNFIAAVLLAQVIIWANSGHAKPAMLLVIYGGYFIWLRWQPISARCWTGRPAHIAAFGSS